MQKYSDTHSNYAPPPDSSSGMLVRVCRWRGQYLRQPQRSASRVVL